MNICLYTMHSNSTIGQMAALTVPNKIQYCNRHGYAYHEEPWRGELFPGFERLPVLIYLLKCGYFDWVFWLGTDALITNLSRKLEELVDENHGMIMATDFTQIQMDSFLCQPKHGTIELLEAVWARRENPIGPWYEQSTLEHFMHEKRFRHTVKIVPQRRMNAYKHKWYSEWKSINSRVNHRLDCLGTDGEWQVGDFVFHIPGRPLETKMQALREIIPLIMA